MFLAGAIVAILLAACSPAPDAMMKKDAPTLDAPMTEATLVMPKGTSADATAMMNALLDDDRDRAMQSLLRVKESRDTRFIAPLIELLRAAEIGLTYTFAESQIVPVLESLSGQTFGNDWSPWVEWYGGTELKAPPGFTGWKGKLLSRIDPRFADFLRDDVPSKIRVEEIVWGGVRVDGIPALDNPTLITAPEATYLNGDEPVFGVSIQGDHRAYPLRILDWHEMANDVVGGVPISLAY